MSEFVPENPNLQLPVPAPKPHLLLWLLVFVFILILVSAVAWFFFSRPKAAPLTVQPTAQMQAYPPTVAQEQALVDAHSKLTFPSISKTTPINSSALPAELSGFILPSSTDISIDQVTFADSSQGYGITYGQAGQVSSVYGKLFSLSSQWGTAEPPNFSLVSATNTSLAGAIEEQSSQYQVKIDVSAWQPGSLVSVTARLVN